MLERRGLLAALWGLRQDLNDDGICDHVVLSFQALLSSCTRGSPDKQDSVAV